MKRLTMDQLMISGGETPESNCGSSTETAIVEFTCALGGAFIGFGLTAGNIGGAIYGAKAGYTACKLACHA